MGEKRVGVIVLPSIQLDLLYQLIGQVIHLLFYGDHLKDIDDKRDHNSGDQDINKGANIGRFPFLRF